MLSDPEDYPDPSAFKPERFISADGKIDPNVRSPREILFGFGRRICPGFEFAIQLMELSIASLVQVFIIKAGVDEDGVPITLTIGMGNETICSPETFPRSFEPRSTEAIKLIGDDGDEASDYQV
ncbi:hypothetical protein EIP91_004770 [Steccherinum ochraceum]|uniref:Cytochrome P450-dit2 n=1 Tax=Steccherinum ochraceum TaxID=92696 RepID=A0A4R0RB92_9APHY|nr:hypothetical protein EIP91_004770 [Steccherinum ochraceum]